jgi:hypothetical protein
MWWRRQCSTLLDERTVASILESSRDLTVGPRCENKLANTERLPMTPEPFISSELRPPLPTYTTGDRATADGPRDEVVDDRLRQARAVTAATVFKPAADVQVAVLDDDAVLLNLDTGVYYTLNRVGTVVWDLLTGERALGAISSAVCNRFAVAEDVAWADLTALVVRLEQEGLVEEVTPGFTS